MPNYSESLPELFGRVSKAETKDEKKSILLKNNSNHLKTILQGVFHPGVIWGLPEGSPPYKKDDAEYGLSPSVLEREIRKLPYFISSSGGKLIQNKMKREEIFVQILESVHPSEAELLIQMKDKTIKCDGLTARLVWETFPDIMPEPEESVPEEIVTVPVKKRTKKRTKKVTNE